MDEHVRIKQILPITEGFAVLTLGEDENGHHCFHDSAKDGITCLLWSMAEKTLMTMLLSMRWMPQAMETSMGVHIALYPNAHVRNAVAIRRQAGMLTTRGIRHTIAFVAIPSHRVS